MNETVFSQRKKSYCFGAGREDFAKTVVNIGNMPADAKNPGPGTYSDTTKNIALNARKYSLQPRTMYMNTIQAARKRNITGPGTYGDP